MYPDNRLSRVVVPFEVFNIIIKELHIFEMNGVLDFTVRQNNVNGFRLEEIKRLHVLIPLYFLNFLNAFVDLHFLLLI